MSSAEPAPAPAAGRGILQRLDLIYFALAGFDLLTIGIALVLGHLTVTAFEEGVRTSAVWSQRQADIIHLSRLAQIADAPGNDIFYSRDVALERGRFYPALAEFNADRARIAQQVAAAQLSERDGEIARRLDTSSNHDVAIHSGIAMWVSAFDHSQTRHTRHMRPLILELETKK